jgi:hypothetical protein
MSRMGFFAGAQKLKDRIPVVGWELVFSFDSFLGDHYS